MAQTEKNLMDMVPKRLRDFEKKEDGSISVLYPRFNWGPLRKWLQPYIRQPFFRINLDAIGSKVWERIDGKRTVYSISVKTARDFGEKEDEIWHQRMAIYMQMLRRSNLIRWQENSRVS